MRARAWWHGSMGVVDLVSVRTGHGAIALTTPQVPSQSIIVANDLPPSTPTATWT